MIRFKDLESTLEVLDVAFEEVLLVLRCRRVSGQGSAQATACSGGQDASAAAAPEPWPMAP